ncbi:unnamed protein product [Linum trigynum]|uniref:Replication factor-A protein 1 N-terminal domain-containing protein n=1 Tax=Linum trigynum TaxID=586398 RepID=A0AAV2DIT0_9ROSI
MADLTQGAIALIAGGATSGELQPTLQVTELREVQAKQQQKQQHGDRFRLILSDGSHLQQAMLGIQLNPLVQQGKLRAGSIVHMKHYSHTIIQERMVIIVLELAVVVEESALIGLPSLLKMALPRHHMPPTAQPTAANASANPQSSGSSSAPLDDESCAQLREQIQRLTEENTRLQQRCGNQDKVVSTVVEQNKRLTEENKRLYEKYNHLEENLSRIIEQNRSLTEQNTRLHERRGHLEKTLGQVVESCNRSLNN